MNAFMQCVISQVRDGIRNVIYSLGVFAGAIFAVFTVAFVACVVSALAASGGAGVVACVEAYLTAVLGLIGVVALMFAVLVVVVAIAATVDCLAASLLDELGAATGLPGVLPGAESPIDCATAQDLLRDATARLQDAQRRRDDAAARARRARRDLQTAVAIGVAAVAALAAAFFRPDLWLPLTAAVVAASALVARRTRAAAAAEANLALAETQLIRAAAEVAAASALVNQLCKPPRPDVPPVRPVPDAGIVTGRSRVGT